MIYFCIPAHNEERTVGVVLWKLRQVMGELNRDYQIIVVDDASSDSTADVLSPYIRVLPLTVIRNAQRHGYADSLELAIREAVRRAPYPKRDALIVLQADFTEDPDIVPALVKRIEAGADLVATDTTLEDDVPLAFRWARLLLRWTLKGKDWVHGDPLSGLRAYRIVTVKRAIESRATNRLITWNSWGSHVELMAQTVPHSRRTDVVETSMLHHRHQRDSRFSFLKAVSAVRGAAAGKINAATGALPNDGVIAVPQPMAVEPSPRSVQQSQQQRGRERLRSGPQRSRNPQQRERPVRGQRPDRPKKRAAPVAPPPLVEASAISDQPKKKRRRRPRRKKEKSPQENGAQAVAETTETAEALSLNIEEPQPAGGAPRKKSRRGRRGGRGRRRTVRSNEDNSTPEAQIDGGSGSDGAPPQMAAGGD